ncbi:preprotein translocase subunit SecY [Evansella cellulosilytica]|uniref:Protein translocase subunit SecY n=1 Tax=Evansella cellulosilytica (strain ATCC 21833 / DSM 2522 / FERM P-1141 / JCM 9156 / N-4) TaxID=649639 RepID=E6TQS2_EVAC2|nr:preprotein translocase subunit SecY [Evansella cellulosilytica]ADU31697.1 preprotein translocase, SecY subunit [Evansella cellulosilytica DSM 2522]
MFRTIRNIFRVGELRNKIIFTLLMLLVFRIGAHIPAPGVNPDALNFDGLAAFGLLDTFGGGALERFSIFATGIMPYITASIIVQLLRMDVVPKFAEWAKEGEAGRKKLAQVTRYGTIGIAFLQALALSIGFNNIMPGVVPDPSVTTYLLIAVVLTAGTAFLMWVGEQITAQGVGNGISIIIFGGIVAAIPNGVRQIYTTYIVDAGDQLFLNIVTILLIALAILAVIVAIIFVQQAVRKVTVQYAKKMAAGGKKTGGQSTHIPLKVNAAGVIPVIFASALFFMPQTVAGIFGSTDGFGGWIIQYVNLQEPVGMVVYAALIIAFAYFYTFIQMNPEQMAENLKKQNGFIPGIRPGKATQTYIVRTLYRLTFVGSLFLATVAVMPLIFTRAASLPPAVQIGGTGLLIVTAVALDTMKQVESQLIERRYSGFLKKSS